ncbi:MAG TPA: DUF58 domain-containing protein [Desulfotomaculum sp.]|nr:MAG: hypothetical protein JL56_16650 [Desulfotomaculum sp. BICA1-6]HBX22946.1 DUF58 domain-containing protein [Desulfotomaculum sp.]
MKNTRVLSTTPAASLAVRLLAAAAALVTVYYRMPLPFLLLILLLSYLMWSYYWTLMSCRSTTGTSLAAQESIFAGETLTREFKFVNGWLFPLVRCGISFLLPAGLTCTGDTPQTMTRESKSGDVPATTFQLAPAWNYYTVHYVWLPEKKEFTVRLQIQAGLRGIYYLPPPHLFVGDPSGLFRGLNQVGREQYLYVFPRLKSTGELHKALDFQENNREDNFGLEDRYQAQGVRDYQLADSPKSINWYATARANSLKSNIYQRKDSQFCLVALDLCVPVQPAYALDAARFEDPNLEEAISLAAGIALFHLEQGAMTAFYTNAPLLQWKKKKDNPLPDDTSAYMNRVRPITTLDFAGGTSQAQSILKICAAIDETSRAYPEARDKLWEKIQAAPANTLIYLLRYHDPPASWENDEEYKTKRDNAAPAQFYSQQRLADLASSRVRLFNLSP